MQIVSVESWWRKRVALRPRWVVALAVANGVTMLVLVQRDHPALLALLTFVLPVLLEQLPANRLAILGGGLLVGLLGLSPDLASPASAKAPAVPATSLRLTILAAGRPVNSAARVV